VVQKSDKDKIKTFLLQILDGKSLILSIEGVIYSICKSIMTLNTFKIRPGQKLRMLSSIHGDYARIYEQAASILLQGELPAGWQWVPCSKDAVVAATTESPIVFYKEFLPRNKFNLCG
jgi:hypothetical protein